MNDFSSFDELDTEAQLYAAAGVDIVVDAPREVPFELTRSITARNQAQFNPAAFLDHIGGRYRCWPRDRGDRFAILGSRSALCSC